MKTIWIIFLASIALKSSCKHENSDENDKENFIVYSNFDVKNYPPLNWNRIHKIYSIGDSKEKNYEKLSKLILEEGLKELPNTYSFYNSNDTLLAYYRPLIIDNYIEGGTISFMGTKRKK